MDEKESSGEAMPEIKMEGSDKNTLMAAIAYVGPLVIVSYLIAKDDPFTKFHVRQGLVLLVLEVIVWFLMATFWFLFPIWQLANVVIFVLAVIGIVNVLKGKEKELPLVGKYAHKIKI